MCNVKYDKMARCYDNVFLIRAVYCRGSGLELLSAFLSMAVCHDSKVKFRCRLTLESWHTAKDKNADNNSKPLPRQYTALIKKT